MNITLLVIYTLLSMGMAVGVSYGGHMLYINHNASFDSAGGQKELFGIVLTSVCTVLLLLFGSTAWAFWRVVQHAA